MGGSPKKSYVWRRVIETREEMVHTFKNIFAIGQDIIEGVKNPTGLLPLLLPGLFFVITTVFFFPELLLGGHIVHSDLDFGFQDPYLFRVFPLWNEEWSTTNFFNLPRIIFLAPLALISKLLNFSPSLWEKSIIGLLLWISAISFYSLLRFLFNQDALAKRLKSPKIFMIFASLLGGIFYAYNPFVAIRIQHLYLLVGYAFFPLVFLALVILTEHLPPQKTNSLYGDASDAPLSWWQKIRKTRAQTIAQPYDAKVVWRALLSLPVLWAVSTGAVHYLVFIFFLISTWGLYRIIRYSLQGRFFTSWIITRRLFLSGVLTLLLLGFFFWPYWSASQIGSVNPPNINSIDSIDQSSRNNIPLWILFLISYWWNLLDIPSLPMTFWIGGGLLLSTMLCASLFRIHNKFVLYGTLSAGVLYALSFGTKWVPKIYLWLIFENPLSGFFGFIFRDSNKFVGLLAFFLALLFGYGIITILERFFQIYLDEQRWGKSKRKKAYFSIIILSLCTTWTLALYFYFAPVHELYFHHFYHPVTIPKSYGATRDFLAKEAPNLKRNLILPRCERLVSPGSEYCLNTWNAQKNESSKKPPRAGSSQDITSLSVRTFHPLEGTTVFWGLLYDYLFENLSQNRSQNTGRLLSLLGIENLVLHKDILGLETELEVTEDSLSHQNSLKEVSVDLGFFKIFKPASVPWAHLYARKLLSFSGLPQLDAFLQIPEFQAQDTAFLFGYQSEKKDFFKTLNDQDLLETKSALDLWMSQVGEKYKRWPFDFTLWGNPSAHWSRLRTDTSDWDWYLDSIGLKGAFGDFDGSKGIAYTAASAQIDLGPYDDFERAGIPYKFPASESKDTSLFISDVPERLTIQEGFSKASDSLPAVFAKQQVGPGQYWRVAKTRRLETKSNHGYYFELTISGRKAHQLHAKIKYFDAAGQEIGVAYTASPGESEKMDFTKFKTVNVSPPESETFQIEILSLEDLETSGYWQLNELKILDLGSVTKPNLLTIPSEADLAGEYEIFFRAFSSPKGGALKLKRQGDLEEYAKTISTQSSLSKFKWFSAGTFLLKSGENLNLEIENLSGLNAINTVVFLPRTILETIQKDTEEKINHLHQIIVLESDRDFEKRGNAQNTVTNPKLTNGEAIELRDGSLKTKVEILKSGFFTPTLRLKTFPKNQATHKNMTLQITDEKNGEILGNFPMPLEGLSDWEWKSIPRVLLEKGLYTFTLDFQDQSPSLLQIQDFKAWDSRDFDFTLSLSEKDTQGCSPHIKASSSHTTLFLEENLLRGEMEKSVSCDWISAVSKPLRVSEGTSYLLEYQLDAEHHHQLHLKLLFFDRDRKFIKSIPYGVSEEESFSALKKEDIFIAPPSSRYVQMQILARAHPEHRSFWKLQNLQLRSFSSLPGLDLLVLKPPLKTPLKAPPVESVKKTILGYDLTIGANPEKETRNYVLQLGESFTPFWGLRTPEGKRLPPNPSLLVLNAFDIRAGDISQTFSYEFLLELDFLKGLFVSLVTLTSLLLIALHLLVPPKTWKNMNKFFIRNK